MVPPDELQRRVETHGPTFAWESIRQDLEALCEVETREGSEWRLLRTALQGVPGKVPQATGVGTPPAFRPLEGVVPKGPGDPDSIAVSQTLP